MKIKVRADRVRLSLMVPSSMAAWAVRRIPESILVKMRHRVKAPYDELLTKKMIALLTEACVDVLKENRGLEIVNVKTSGGDFVSIVL